MSRGKGWEAVLRQVHARYKREGRAVIDKTDPPFVRVRDAGRGAFVARFSGTGPVDFFGCVKGGRMVAFDAKDCQGRRWPLSKLHPHQARCLDAYASVGALTGVALRMGGRGWWLPWERLGPMWWACERGEAKRGEKSIAQDWLDYGWMPAMRLIDIGTEKKPITVHADWLSAALSD